MEETPVSPETAVLKLPDLFTCRCTPASLALLNQAVHPLRLLAPNRGHRTDANIAHWCTEEVLHTAVGGQFQCGHLKSAPRCLEFFFLFCATLLWLWGNGARAVKLRLPRCYCSFPYPNKVGWGDGRDVPAQGTIPSFEIWTARSKILT